MARKWTNRDLAGALHFITANNYIHNNPLKSGLVKSSADYRWSSFRAFYSRSGEPLPVDRDWWWPEDVRKLEIAVAEWQKEISQETEAAKAGK